MNLRIVSRILFKAKSWTMTSFPSILKSEKQEILKDSNKINSRNNFSLMYELLFLFSLHFSIEGITEQHRELINTPCLPGPSFHTKIETKNFQEVLSTRFSLYYTASWRYFIWSSIFINYGFEVEWHRPLLFSSRKTNKLINFSW